MLKAKSLCLQIPKCLIKPVCEVFHPNSVQCFQIFFSEQCNVSMSFVPIVFNISQMSLGLGYPMSLCSPQVGGGPLT